MVLQSPGLGSQGSISLGLDLIIAAQTSLATVSLSAGVREITLPKAPCGFIYIHIYIYSIYLGLPKYILCRYTEPYSPMLYPRCSPDENRVLGYSILHL